jgi:beta-fructofuranosidase
VSLVDKTLVVWASPANLTQSGGTALTVNDTTIDRFDGVVFAELEPQVWMPGSNGYSRTDKTQADWPQETAGPDELVQLAIVYQGRQITVYRNGEVYAAYASPGEPYPFGGNTAILFGPRHLQKASRAVSGASATRGSMPSRSTRKPSPRCNRASRSRRSSPGRGGTSPPPAPTTGPDGSTRSSSPGARGSRTAAWCSKATRPAMLATIVRDDFATAEIPARWSRHDPVPASVVQSTRMFREKLLDDPYRPRYHFCVPEDNGMPGDANGCFYANGRYHLMYLYNRNGVGFCWGHISSQDLVHWRHHPDAIGPGDGDEGCFSGGAFVDDDGTAYLSYWMLWGDKGIGLARSTDRHYERWQKLDANPVIKSTEWGITETTGADGNKLIYGSSDPSNIWKKDGKYYVLTGNLLVLNKYGRKPDSPESMQGDWLDLLESDDLPTWTYKGRLLRAQPRVDRPSEDNMCPSFLPLPASPTAARPAASTCCCSSATTRAASTTWAATTRRTTVHPEQPRPHDLGRQHVFRPGSPDRRPGPADHVGLADRQSRRRGGPRLVGCVRAAANAVVGRRRHAAHALRSRNSRCSAPTSKTWSDVALADGGRRSCWRRRRRCVRVGDHPGPSDRRPVRRARCARRPAARSRRCSTTTPQARQLVFDATRSGTDGRGHVERAPLALKDGEPLRLRVFVDKSVIEVYANDRQAICRRVYPGRDDSLDVVLFSAGADAVFNSVKTWEMMPSNPY